MTVDVEDSPQDTRQKPCPLIHSDADAAPELTYQRRQLQTWSRTLVHMAHQVATI